MADAPAYMIANLTIKDATRYGQYEKGFFPILKKHGAEIRLKSKPTQSFSGSKADFVILIDFPDADAASAAFDSPEYHAIVPTRDLALERINIVALG